MKSASAESRLYYYRARYYDPEIGRFLSHDPEPGMLARSVTLNPYQYAFNNPVRYIDPLGAAGESWTYGGQGTALGSNSVSRYAYEARYWRGNPAGLQSYIDAAKQMQQAFPNDPKVANILSAAEQRMAEIASGGSNAPIVKPPTAPTATAPTGAAPSAASGTAPTGAAPSSASGTMSNGAAPSSPTGTRPLNTSPSSSSGTAPTGTASTGTAPTGTASPQQAVAPRPRPSFGTYNRFNVPVTPGFGSQVWTHIKNGVRSPVGGVLTGIVVVGVVYNTVTAAPGQRLVTAVRGSGGVIGGIIGSGVATALVSNPAGWTLLALGLVGGTIGGFVGDRVGVAVGDLGTAIGGLFGDSTQGVPPPGLPPDHPTTGNVADNPLFPSQLRSMQNASPPANTTAGSSTASRDLLKALPRSSSLPPLPKLSSQDKSKKAKPKPTSGAQPDYSGAYSWANGVYGGFSKSFSWKQNGGDAATVTFNMDGRLAPTLRQHGLPATVTATVKRSGKSYVMVGDPLGAACSAAVTNFEKSQGNAKQFTYNFKAHPD